MKVSDVIPNTVNIDFPAAREAATEENNDADQALTAIKEMVVESNDDLGTALVICAEVKESYGRADERRQRFITKAKEIIDEANDLFQPAMKSLGEAEEVIKKKITDLVGRRTTEQDRLLVQAGGVGIGGDAAAAQILMEEADALTVPKIAGLSVRESWDGEVTDPTKIPTEYLMPDIKALKARSKSLGTDPGIPGWKAKKTRSAVVTVSKVKR